MPLDSPLIASIMRAAQHMQAMRTMDAMRLTPNQPTPAATATHGVATAVAPPTTPAIVAAAHSEDGLEDSSILYEEQTHSSEQQQQQQRQLQQQQQQSLALSGDVGASTGMPALENAESSWSHAQQQQQHDDDDADDGPAVSFYPFGAGGLQPGSAAAAAAFANSSLGGGGGASGGKRVRKFEAMTPQRKLLEVAALQEIGFEIVPIVEDDVNALREVQFTSNLPLLRQYLVKAHLIYPEKRRAQLLRNEFTGSALVQALNAVFACSCGRVRFGQKQKGEHTNHTDELGPNEKRSAQWLTRICCVVQQRCNTS